MWVVCVFDGGVNNVFDEHSMGKFVFTVTGNVEEVVCLHAARFLQHLHDRCLNLRVRIVNVNEDLLDSITVQAA